MIPRIKRSKINLSYDNSKRRVQRIGAFLGSVFVLHVLGMMIFEDMNMFQAIWLTGITLTTIGYGDVSASTIMGQITTLLIASSGIFILANFADAFLSFRSDQKEAQRQGKWKWGFKDHILIMNFPDHYNVDDMSSLIKSIREIKKFENSVIQLLTDRFDGKNFPEELFELENVAFYNGLPTRQKNLEAVNIKEAAGIITLSLLTDNDPDGYTFDIVNRVRANNKTATLICQCLQDSNRERLRNEGADTCFRPVRAYPEIIAHALEQKDVIVSLFEDLISSTGDELLRVDLDKSYSLKWQDVIMSMTSNCKGLPLGYIDENKNIVLKPTKNEIHSFQSIIFWAYTDTTKNVSIESIFNDLENK